jgi:hypothetical protein
MEAEVHRLEALQKELDRDYRRVPFLFVFGLLTIPVYFIWGATAAIYAILCTPCLVITALYLIGVRKADNKKETLELRRTLRRMPEEA